MERKVYDVQERPKLAVNGALPMTTFFVLNKRDRNGKLMQRPFITILNEMKKQEAEEAKLKQTNSLKGGGRSSSTSKPRDSVVGPVPVPEGHEKPAAAENHPPVAVVKIEEPTPPPTQETIIDGKNFDDQSLQTNETISERNQSTKILGRPIRSRACELL